MGRTLSRVQQALSWSYCEDMKPFKPPLSDAEFHSYLNGQGQLYRPEELRLRIYHGGVEPSLRKVPLWTTSSWLYLQTHFRNCGLLSNYACAYFRDHTVWQPVQELTHFCLLLLVFLLFICLSLFCDWNMHLAGMRNLCLGDRRISFYLIWKVFCRCTWRDYWLQPHLWNRPWGYSPFNNIECFIVHNRKCM